MMFQSLRNPSLRGQLSSEEDNRVVRFYIIILKSNYPDVSVGVTTQLIYNLMATCEEITNIIY